MQGTPFARFARLQDRPRFKRDEDKLWMYVAPLYTSLPRSIPALPPSRDRWSYQVMHPLVKNPPPSPLSLSTRISPLFSSSPFFFLALLLIGFLSLSLSLSFILLVNFFGDDSSTRLACTEFNRVSIIRLGGGFMKRSSTGDDFSTMEIRKVCKFWYYK